jgi:hypothetical protein
MRERRKSKEKISGSGAMVKGKWPYYDIMNFLEYYLQCRHTTGSVPQMAAATVSFANPEELKSAILSWKEKVHVMTRIWKAVRINRSSQQELKEGKNKN